MLLWQVWGDDLWQLYHKVTFDGYNKLIIINADENEIDVAVDIYSAWKEWAKSRDYLKWDAAMRSVGGDPLPGGDALGRTFFTINDWKIYIDHGVNFIGNLFADDGSSPFVLADGTQLVTISRSTLVEKPNLDENNASIFV